MSAHCCNDDPAADTRASSPRYRRILWVAWSGIGNRHGRASYDQWLGGTASGNPRT